MYDILIVGAGLYGAVFAHEARKKGYKCLVVEKRDHTGGNIYCKNINNINVHYYGPHIFHTADEKIWNYVNQFVRFNHFIYSPVANFRGELYNLPFNMNTFYQLWKVINPKAAQEEIDRQSRQYRTKEPQNLEEMALSLVGEDIYYKLVKGYTEKQWGRLATEIPAFIIKRIPLRFTFDNNYFNDPFQGIPIGGYNAFTDSLLDGTEVILGVDFLDNKEAWRQKAKRVVYTGEIDKYFDYCFGRLEYRSLRFEHELLENVPNYQGCAAVNYTAAEVPYTRTLEHKHFEFGQQPDTVVTREYPSDFTSGMEPYYPVNDENNNNLYLQYKQLAGNDPSFHFCGRLGAYKYYNMDQIIEAALNEVGIILK